MSAKFRIATIANDLEQYREMKDSFTRAGFDESNTSYVLYDNTRGNVHDPYHVLSQLLADDGDEYKILCHQDVLATCGDGYAKLTTCLAQLDAQDPNWAVAGNAGGKEDLRCVTRISDPSGDDQKCGEFPASVLSLDENFLLINPRSRVAMSPGLSGFHLYGTDLCLNSRARGYRCYVIDFHIRHKGAGTIGRAFAECKQAIELCWGARSEFMVVRTMCTTLVITRSAPRRLLVHWRINLVEYLRVTRRKVLRIAHRKRAISNV